MPQSLDDFTFHISHYSSRETRDSSRYRWDNSAWPDRNFVIIQQTLSGAGIYENKAGPHRVGPGQAFLAIVPERSIYYYPAGSPESWTFRWLNMRGSFAHSFWRAFRDEFGSVLSLDHASSAHRHLDELFHLLDGGPKADPSEQSELIYSFASVWQRELREVTTRPRDPLREAVAFCERHYRLPIKVKEIAENVGLSREHLTRIFQERYGVSPAAYLRRLRVTMARQLLESTGHPLVEIARRTGFQDARQLRKWLRAAGE